MIEAILTGFNIAIALWCYFIFKLIRNETVVKEILEAKDD